MAPKLRPGYRSLFYGPPGTGKTMTACLLGKSPGASLQGRPLAGGLQVYRRDREELAQVFDQAQHKGWILFFDEADALFGKRSEIRDAHDRYANQEIAFLLQRIESFDGIAILASNAREYWTTPSPGASSPLSTSRCPVRGTGAAVAAGILVQGAAGGDGRSGRDRARARASRAARS